MSKTATFAARLPISGALAGSLLLRFTSVEGVLLAASAAMMFSLLPLPLLPAPAQN